MIKEFKKGDVIFREGDTGDNVYQIEEGTVSVYAGYGEDDQTLLTELGKGRFFGEMATIDDYPRSATVVANENLKVLEIRRAEIKDYFKSNPEKIIDIMKGMTGRLRALTDDYAEASHVVAELSDNMDKEFGGALVELIMNLVTKYKRNKAITRLSAETERGLEKSVHSSGYSAEIETFDKGDIIFREGDKSDCMYDIHFGSIGIYDGYGTPSEKLLTTLTSNMFFGELGMIDNVERSCTAVAMEDATTLEIITAADLPELFEKNPEKLKMIFGHLAFRIRQLTREYVNACRTVDRVNEAKKRGEIDDDLKSSVAKSRDDLLVVRSLKL